jgi:hypothetical protein
VGWCMFSGLARREGRERRGAPLPGLWRKPGFPIASWAAGRRFEDSEPSVTWQRNAHGFRWVGVLRVERLLTAETQRRREEERKSKAPSRNALGVPSALSAFSARQPE